MKNASQMYLGVGIYELEWTWFFEKVYFSDGDSISILFFWLCSFLKVEVFNLAKELLANLLAMRILMKLYTHKKSY